MEQKCAQYHRPINEYVVRHIGDALKQSRGFIRDIDAGSVYGGNVWDWDAYEPVYGLFGMADVTSGGSFELLGRDHEACGCMHEVLRPLHWASHHERRFYQREYLGALYGAGTDVAEVL